MDADVLNLANNMSDHSPIYCQFNINNLRTRTQIHNNATMKPSWKNASAEQKSAYKVVLQDRLNDIEIPENIKTCCDVHCNRYEHNSASDDFLISLLENIQEVSSVYLPSSRPLDDKRTPSIACWSTEVLPFKDNALFWHSIWESAGKPLNTELHTIMKRTRNVYHYQIRKCKKMKQTIKRNTLLAACLLGNGDFFKEIRKIRKSNPTVANVIDGVCDDIPNHFAGIYNKLYNSCDDCKDVSFIYDQLEKSISFSSIIEVEKITPALVMEAMNHLKCSKSDPLFEFNSDCLKNAPWILSEHMSTLFKSYLVHGHVSSVLMMSTLIPILKDKLGNICDANNYRSIAISSLVLKIFDWVIILLYGDKLGLDELQFSYQKNCSTNMCSWMVIETIEYFVRNGSELFTCAMDMSKAFDKVKHSLLFKKLLTKGLPEIYIRLLLIMYNKQIANVRWHNSLSQSFPISNGVKQGAVLSAILFCVYVNDLYNLLRRKKCGCWIDGHYIGILGYSDDIILLAPSVDALKDMVQTCEEYASSHNLEFSTHPIANKSKTKCMAFTKNDRIINNIKLCGNELPWVNTIKHLGSVITNNSNKTNQDVMEKRAAYISKNNEINQEFGYAHPSSKVKINNTFNTSFYGSVLWNLFSKEAERIEKSWNISQRVMLGLDFKTHRYFIEPLSGTKHIMFSLFKRLIRFIQKIGSCKKGALKTLLKAVKHDCRSTTGANLRKIMLRVNKHNIDDIQVEDIDKLEYNPIPDGEIWRVRMIKELIDVKAGVMAIPDFAFEEITSMIDIICTS